MTMDQGLILLGMFTIFLHWISTQGLIPILRGFEPIGSYHRQLGNAARAAAT